MQQYTKAYYHDPKPQSMSMEWRQKKVPEEMCETGVREGLNEREIRGESDGRERCNRGMSAGG